jgi:hypothetical protein
MHRPPPRLHQVGQGAAEAVELPYDKDVTLAESLNGAIEAGPTGRRAAHALVGEYLSTPGRLERVALQGKILVSR